MQDTTRAVLFSMLLCPGSGHLYLRRWWRAAVYMVPFLLAVCYYIYYSVDNTIDIINMVVDGEIEPDQTIIQAELRDRLWRNPSNSLWVSRLTLLFCWLVAAVDVYFLSRRQFGKEADT
jgi:ABC-type Fe3+ transport system permease subunit